MLHNTYTRASDNQGHIEFYELGQTSGCLTWCARKKGSPVLLSFYMPSAEMFEGPYSLSGNTLCVGYHLCIRHILGTVFELYQSSENTHRYFHIINAKNMYRPSYAA